jgi:EpsD family peptidyl-prolyl cis-trans isomerase
LFQRLPAQQVVSWTTPLAIVLIAGLILAACGRKEESAAGGQVIGHIGPEAITIQELQNEIRVLNVPPDSQRNDAVVKQILSEIAARKYVVQQAVAAKLDRQPTVLLDVLRAREQVLSAAYIQREIGAKSAGIGKGEVDSFIQAHPDQFAGREEFSIDQISFQSPKDMDELSAATKDYKSLEQIDAKLNELGIKHVRHPGAIDGATLPDNVIASLKARKDDDVFLLRAAEGATFFKVVAMTPKPLTGDDAERLARRALLQELLRTTSADAAKAALASATFEGDYARVMGSPGPSAATPAPSPTPSKQP